MLNGLQFFVLVPGCKVASMMTGRLNLLAGSGSGPNKSTRPEHLPQCIHGSAHLGANAMISIVMLRHNHLRWKSVLNYWKQCFNRPTQRPFPLTTSRAFRIAFRSSLRWRHVTNRMHQHPPCADINQSSPTWSSTSAPDVIVHPAKKVLPLSQNLFLTMTWSDSLCAWLTKRSLFSALGLLSI